MNTVQNRYFLLMWLKKQGIDDALIQPYSGHASRQSLEIYSWLALDEAQAEYEEVIGHFPIVARSLAQDPFKGSANK